MKKSVLLIFISLLSSVAFGQSKFHFGMDYYYSLGLQEKEVELNEVDTRADYAMAGHTIRLTEWYDATDKFTVGLGVAMDHYVHPGYFSFPVVASCMWHPFDKAQRLFGFADLGYAAHIHSDNVNVFGGMLGNVGIGCRVISLGKTDLNVRLGYNFRQFTGIPYENYAIVEEYGHQFLEYVSTDYHQSHRHSLTLGAGLVF